jgi:glycosyltransferase involved in cell wall biosynthesis
MNRLTAIILTYDESRNIEKCIASLHFADQVLVFDSYSTDNTVSLAHQAGVQVIQHSFENYASQRNAALQAVAGTTEWVLFVDADERATPELAAEIVERINEPNNYAGWRIPRHNYIFGKLTCGAGWYPDYQTRLLRAGAARYDSERQVHELVILDGAEGTLTQPFIHYNYRDAPHFVRKQQQYAAYDARILFEQSIRPKPHNYLLQPWRQFWWRFVTLRGYHDGLHGLRLSAWMAWYELRKYLLLRKLWQGNP